MVSNRVPALLGLARPRGDSKPLDAEDRGPAIINPLFATTMSEARVNELVFEGLYADDLDLAPRPDWRPLTS